MRIKVHDVNQISVTTFCLTFYAKELNTGPGFEPGVEAKLPPSRGELLKGFPCRITMPVDDNCDPLQSESATAGSPESVNQAAGASASETGRNVPIQVVRPMQFRVVGGSQSPSASPVYDSSSFDQESTDAYCEADQEEMLNMQRQQDEIEQETKKLPLVTDKLPMEELVTKYSEGSQFRQKATELAERYKHIQFTRRDGNCFYRAVLSVLFDAMVKDQALFDRFSDRWFNDWFKRIVQLGYTEFTVQDICDFFTEALNSIRRGDRDITALLSDLTNDAASNYFVSFFRLLAATFLREKEEDFAPFLTEYSSMKDFCEHEVEPMWKEADHLVVVGLSHALNLSIRVEYLDQSAAPNGQPFYNFIVDGDDDPRLTVLFTPGHYDALHKD
ncbi:hypothetical protein QR680_005502 [Steinernema hermaphroditum]|uniref:ubiquitinyl hydrolase 1 n=1 Tax=Steinernema hermaphroditum TaxID=289476 RepID=A0AA39HUH2_9BILA|nr:hypothetical protein QR680_005502 [Steinernema hermaphroditum]